MTGDREIRWYINFKKEWKDEGLRVFTKTVALERKLRKWNAEGFTNRIGLCE